MSDSTAPRRDQALALTTAFLALFSIVGVALYGLPFFYDFFVTDLASDRVEDAFKSCRSLKSLPATFRMRSS